MTPEQHKHWKFCVEQLGVRIYPVPVTSSGSVLIIEVNTNGKPKQGTEQYRTKEIYDKIHELYKKYYELNINKLKAELQQ